MEVQGLKLPEAQIILKLTVRKGGRKLTILVHLYCVLNFKNLAGKCMQNQTSKASHRAGQIENNDF